MTYSEQRNTRFTPEQAAEVDRVAEEAGLSVSELVRLAVLSAVERCPLCGAHRAHHGPSVAGMAEGARR